VPKLRLETLLRAVRRPDAPTVRHFATAEELADLDDNTSDSLWAAYEAVQVPASSIPTSPVA
jgi:hypothetical protein